VKTSIELLQELRQLRLKIVLSKIGFLERVKCQVSLVNFPCRVISLPNKLSWMLLGVNLLKFFIVWGSLWKSVKVLGRRCIERENFFYYEWK